MARPSVDEELQLRRRARRRLIGAVVLVMLVVLLLPMVLDSEPKPAGQDIDIRIPSPDAGAFKSKIMPVAPLVDGKQGSKPTPATAPGADGSTKDATGAKVASGTTAAPTSKPEAPIKGNDAAKPSATGETLKPPAKAETPAADGAKTQVAAGSHVVQVTALRDAERAARINERIRTAGIRSYTEVVKTDKGDVTRVRAGPFPTSEAAENARDQIRRMDFDGKTLEGKVIPVK
jgi:DedD protein